MVAVLRRYPKKNKSLPPKFRKIVKSSLPTTSTASNTSRSLLPLPEQPQKQQQTQYEKKKSPEQKWVITIKEKLEEARQDDAAGSWGKLSIYRIPHYLREGDDKAYVPQIVSIGPYHHGKGQLRQMDRHKWRSLHRVLERTDQDIQVFLHSMKELEEKTRDCYEGNIDLASNEFLEMMVLDGCFVLELFQGVTVGFEDLGYPKNDPIFAMRGSMHTIRRDILMLENQLPLFVLDRILGIQDPQQKGQVAKLALRFFDPLMPTDAPLTKTDRSRLESSFGHQEETFDQLSNLSGLHCVDVFRRSLLRSGPKPEPPEQRIWIKKFSNNHRVADKRWQQLIHCATELKVAGVKFRQRETDRFWDIKFENGILEIPRLSIDDGTKSLFLNLIAFEQCHFDCRNHITTYVIFMDNLINSPEDVAYLHYCGIIKHWLGSDAEVANLFNHLCQEVVFDNSYSYLSDLSEELNRYYKNPWNTWRASLKYKYFNNPWAIISFLAAVVLLLLTFAQSFYAVYAYYWPRP